MTTLLALLRIENRAEAQPFKCTKCELRQYHFIHNLNSGGSPGCKCQGKQKAEKIFAEKFAKGRCLYSQPQIKVNGLKRSFDFVLMPEDVICCREDLFKDKTLPYVFIEILDRNHKRQDRIDKDVEVFGQVIKDYPNCKVIYIDSFAGTKKQIQKILKSMYSTSNKQVKGLFFGREKYEKLWSQLKEEYLEIKFN